MLFLKKKIEDVMVGCVMCDLSFYVCGCLYFSSCFINIPSVKATLKLQCGGLFSLFARRYSTRITLDTGHVTLAGPVADWSTACMYVQFLQQKLLTDWLVSCSMTRAKLTPDWTISYTLPQTRSN